MKRILVCSHDDDLVAQTRAGLREAGYAVVVARRARGGLAALRRHATDLVIVDLGRAAAEALELCRRVRVTEGAAHLPVLAIAGPARPEERIAAFEAGADDCVAKPISTRELALRAAALLRRTSEPPRPTPVVVVHGPISIDVEEHRVRVDGRDVSLSVLEFGLLAELARRPGHVRSRRELLDRVWRYAAGIETRTVDTHVMRLRRKLGAAGVNVETVQRIGYRLRDPPRATRRR